MARHKNWSENEVRHALALYLLTDFGRLHRGNPDIIALASYLGRSVNAVALKLVNLAALDTSLPQKGMSHASATDRRIWSEYLGNPVKVAQAHETQTQLFDSAGTKIGSAQKPRQEQIFELAEAPAEFVHKSAEDKVVETTRRVGQGFFRKVILASYHHRCALTGIEDKRLLNASHIVAWKDDKLNRVNPSNGICLNALHDRAFDRHLITFDEDYKMIVARHVPNVARRELEKIESTHLEMPSRFLPAQEFLEQHRRKFYDTAQ